MADAEDSTVWCSNCKRDIASVNFVMHDAHCQRNIILCEDCGEPVSRSELDEHFQEHHAPVTCEMCSEQFDREKIEEHKEKLCSKRTVTCCYCELEMLAADKDEHEDFCGSRTELCTKCVQYIMHKDMAKHEESNCSFPATKKQQNSNGSALPGNHGRAMNPFAMDELSRIMNEPGMSASVGAFQRNNLRAARPPGQVLVLPPLHVKNDIRTQDWRPGPSWEPAGNDQRGAKNSNRERENWMAREMAPRGNNDTLTVDHLLALQMNAMDDDGDPVTVNDGPSLPCEFCGKNFSLDDIMIHQLKCRMTAVSAFNVNTEIEQNGTPNNQLQPTQATSDSDRTLPNIVDNLSYAAAAKRLTDHTDLGVGDDSWLPCEFCSECFPEDIIIQHQAICSANMSNTPVGMVETRRRSSGQLKGAVPKNKNITQNLPENRNVRQERQAEGILYRGNKRNHQARENSALVSSGGPRRREQPPLSPDETFSTGSAREELGYDAKPAGQNRESRGGLRRREQPLLSRDETFSTGSAREELSYDAKPAGQNRESRGGSTRWGPRDGPSGRAQRDRRHQYSNSSAGRQGQRGRGPRRGRPGGGRGNWHQRNTNTPSPLSDDAPVYDNQTDGMRRPQNTRGITGSRGRRSNKARRRHFEENT